jgi:hypothetical protein
MAKPLHPDSIFGFVELNLKHPSVANRLPDDLAPWTGPEVWWDPKDLPRIAVCTTFIAEVKAAKVSDFELSHLQVMAVAIWRKDSVNRTANPQHGTPMTSLPYPKYKIFSPINVIVLL